MEIESHHCIKDLRGCLNLSGSEYMVTGEFELPVNYKPSIVDCELRKLFI